MDVRNIATGQAFCSQEVRKAIAGGGIGRPTEFECVDCGKPAAEYDHRDYNKPLEIEPVCRSCNRIRGAAISKAWGGGELLAIFMRCRTRAAMHTPAIIYALSFSVLQKRNGKFKARK